MLLTNVHGYINIYLFVCLFVCLPNTHSTHFINSYIGLKYYKRDRKRYRERDGEGLCRRKGWVAGREVRKDRRSEKEKERVRDGSGEIKGARVREGSE